MFMKLVDCTLYKSHEPIEECGYARGASVEAS